VNMNIKYTRTYRYQDPVFADPSELTVNDFQFKVFLGSVRFIVSGQDMSPEWDWIPLVGFSTNLCWAISSASESRPGTLLLMENDDELTFMLDASTISVSANYTSNIAVCERDLLLQEARSFARCVFLDFAALNPGVGRSLAFRRLWNHAGLGDQILLG
jgi:hypothetical protein